MKNNGKRNNGQIVRAERFEVVDIYGRKGAIFGMSNGIPHVILYDKKKKIRSLWTLDADGSPMLRSWGPDGQTPFV